MQGWTETDMSIEDARAYAMKCNFPVMELPVSEGIEAIVVNDVHLIATRIGSGKTYMVLANSRDVTVASPFHSWQDDVLQKWEGLHDMEHSEGTFHLFRREGDTYFYLETSTGERISFMVYPALYPNSVAGKFPATVFQTLPKKE